MAFLNGSALEAKASLRNATAHAIPINTLEDLKLFRSERDEYNAFAYGCYKKADVHVRTIAQAKHYASGFVVGRGKEYLSWRALPGVFCGDGDLLDDQNITPAELDAVLCEHSWLGEVDRLWDWSCSSGIECERTGRLIKPFRNFRLYVITDDARANPRLLMGSMMHFGRSVVGA